VDEHGDQDEHGGEWRSLVCTLIRRKAVAVAVADNDRVKVGERGR